MAQYKVTAELYIKYQELIESGMSKTSASKELNIAMTTLSDHIKRMNKLRQYDYVLFKRKNMISLVVNDNIYNIDMTTNFYESNRVVLLHLLNRPDYIMTTQEYNLLCGDVDYHPRVHSIVSKVTDLTVRDDKFYYKNKLVSHSLYNILTISMDKNINSNIVKFADLLMKNPDQTVIDQLLDFMGHNDICLYEDGFIKTYKAVTMDYKDHRTGSFDNSVGNVVRMDRSDCDHNPDNTCSSGLHVASLDYIKKISQYSNGVIIECRVDPRHVVSVPTDYDGGKARVCEYTVMCDYKGKINDLCD